MEFSDDKTTATPKMKAFLELEEMLVPVSPELDYDKELAEARDEKYGYFGWYKCCSGFSGYETTSRAFRGYGTEALNHFWTNFQKFR